MYRHLRNLLTFSIGAVSLFRGVAGATEGTRPVSAPPARATLAEFWESRAAFRIDVGKEFGADFGMHFLSAQEDGKRTWVYFIRAADPRAGDHRLAVGLASTADGLRFDDLETVLKPGAAGDWDDRMASFPGDRFSRRPKAGLDTTGRSGCGPRTVYSTSTSGRMEPPAAPRCTPRIEMEQEMMQRRFSRIRIWKCCRKNAGCPTPSTSVSLLCRLPASASRLPALHGAGL